MHQGLFAKISYRFLNIKPRFDFAKTAVVVGILLRLKSYLECRPLWVDECWSAIEIVNRSFLEIIKQEYIFSVSSRPPALFVLIEKISVFCFGNNEWALRLPPFLFSVGSVIGFYYLATRFLSRRAFLIAVWLFAVCEPLVFYAAEAKRYSTSIFVIIFLWAFAYKYLMGPFENRRLLVFGLMGSVFVWLSYPSFFIISAVFIVLGYKVIQEKKINSAVSLIVAAVCVLISVGGIYFLVVQEMVKNDEMRRYFAPGLWQGQHFTLGQLGWIGKIFLHSIRDPAGLAFPVLMLGLMVMGFWGFFAQNRLRAMVLAILIVLTLLAAASGFYPFYGRVILFLVPVYLFLIANGIDFVLVRYFKNNRWVLVILLMFVFIKPCFDSVQYLFQTRVKTENRDLLAFFAQHYQPGDFIYLNQGARYPYYYYALSLGYGKKLEKLKYYLPGNQHEQLSPLGIFVDSPIETGIGEWSPLVYEHLKFDEKGMLLKSYHVGRETIRIVRPRTEKFFLKPGRNWLLLSLDDEQMLDATEKRLNSLFNARGKLLLKYQSKGVGAYLFEI